MADAVHIKPTIFVQAGQSVADCLERSAIPGQPPIPTPGASPADTAAVGLSSAMGTRIAAASAELSPRGPKMRAASAEAAQGFMEKDQQNATRIGAVSQGMPQAPPSTGSGAAASSGVGGGGSPASSLASPASLGPAASSIQPASMGSGGAPSVPPLSPGGGTPSTPTPTPPGMPSGAKPGKSDPTSLPTSAIDGVHGTGSKDMPILTKPGELGPATPWGQDQYIQADPTPGSPGSGVWLPPDSTANKLWQPSYPGELPQAGYEEIAPGKYWPRANYDPNLDY